jgi:hypothetical protein
VPEVLYQRLPVVVSKAKYGPATAKPAKPAPA